MRVALQTNPLLPLTKEIRAIDFLRSASAASRPASPVVQAVDCVHAEAALAKGDAVKCSSAPTRTAPAAGMTVLKTSISCDAPSVQGVQASVPRAGSTGIDSTGPVSPCTRTSIAPG